MKVSKLIWRIERIMFLIFISATLNGQTVIPLYEGLIPNSRPHENEEYSKANKTVDSVVFKVSEPTLKIFLPVDEQINRTALIICPGGGYGGLLTKREGSDVATRFRDLGVAAFVLKYRLPDQRIMNDQSMGPLQDLQTAIKMVRDRAEEWGIDPAKIGVMGFSAGGHLAASSGVHGGVYWVDSSMGDVNVRPDFMLLINPVISFTESIGHLGSRDNLLGKDHSRKKVMFFSNELHVDKNTPPTFLVHNSTDSVVLVENSLRFFEEMRKQGIQTEIHIYGKGEHGFLTWPPFEEWFGRCMNWMEGMDLIHKHQSRPIEFSK